jgi:hypothetical protein
MLVISFEQVGLFIPTAFDLSGSIWRGQGSANSTRASASFSGHHADSPVFPYPSIPTFGSRIMICPTETHAG